MDVVPSKMRRCGAWYRRAIHKVQRALFLVVCAGAAFACNRDTARVPGPDPALADTLKTMIANAYDFSQPGVVERMSGLYPDTGRVISASGGQITTSPDSLRKGIADFWQNIGHNMRNPHWQWDSVYVERLGPDAAVLTGKWSIPHIAPNNQPHVIGGAWTAVFRRINGHWKIVQEHLSAT